MRVDNVNSTDPFFWFPVLEPCRREPAPDHSRVSGYWGRLTFTVETLTPLFVGSGEVEVGPDQRMYYRFAYRDGKYYVPATSLKGALRSLVETLSPSCLRVMHDGPRWYQQCGDPNVASLCPACGLFGSVGQSGGASHRGRVTFEDAMNESSETVTVVEFPQRSTPRKAAPDSDPQWQPRQSAKWRKFYKKEFQLGLDRAWTLENERVEQLTGARFRPTVGFGNLRDWEVGLLVLGLGVAPGHEFNWKLGGAKDRGLGLVRVKLTGVEWAEGRGWHLGRRQVATSGAGGAEGGVGTTSAGARDHNAGLEGGPILPSAALEPFIRAYEQKVRQWRIWEKVEEIVTDLRREYGT